MELADPRNQPLTLAHGSPPIRTLWRGGPGRIPVAFLIRQRTDDQRAALYLLTNQLEFLSPFLLGPLARALHAPTQRWLRMNLLPCRRSLLLRGDSPRRHGEPHGRNVTRTVTVAPQRSMTATHVRRLALCPAVQPALAFLGCRCAMSRRILRGSPTGVLSGLLLDPTLSKPALAGELRERGLLLAASGHACPSFRSWTVIAELRESSRVVAVPPCLPAPQLIT